MQYCPGFSSGASHSHNIRYYSPSADRSPSKKETPRRTVLYRITRQLLHRVITASFKSSRLLPASQAKVVLGPTPLPCTEHKVQIYIEYLSVFSASELGPTHPGQGEAPQLYNWNSVGGNYLPPSTRCSNALPRDSACDWLTNLPVHSLPPYFTWYTGYEGQRLRDEGLSICCTE